MSKHTPGPWTANKCRCGDRACNQYTISVQRSVGFEESNARLIAAAPDMHEALRTLIEKWDRFQDRGVAMTRKDFNEARAVLAKAEGRA